MISAFKQIVVNIFVSVQNLLKRENNVVEAVTEKAMLLISHTFIFNSEQLDRTQLIFWSFC